MDKNRVSVDQLSLMYLLLLMGGKFLSLPSILASDVGHDSWLAMAFSFMWDGVCLCMLLWAIKINRNAKMDIGAILDKSVSKPVAKVIFVIFFVIFVLRTNILLASTYKMFSVTFDVSTNWIVYLIPVGALAIFAIAKGFNAIARTAQLFFALVVISVIALLVSPLSEVKLTELLPVAEAGWGKVLWTSYFRSFWFSDYIFVYFVLDGIKIKKHVFAPMLTSFAVGALLAITLNAVFVAIFGHFAPDFDMAMSKIGVFSAASTTNGRWDWLTLSIWLVSVFLKMIVFIFCAYKCVEKIVGAHFVKVNWISISVVMLTLLLPLFVTAEDILNTVVKWGLIPFTLVQYVLPLLMPLFTKTAVFKSEATDVSPRKVSAVSAREAQHE